jgi:acetate kinase
MATSVVPTTTKFGELVARHANRLRELLRRARSNATHKQDNEYARNVAKAILSSDKSKALEQCVALVIDVAQRGSCEEAEAIGQHLVAIARSEHAAAHPDQRVVQLSRSEAQLAEEHSEGKVEEAELAMALNPSLANNLAYLAASAEHTRARRVLDEAVRREVARS